ncbi:MAG: mucoidy inhibitor MuiA family protein [Chloroflexota bacterium]
MDIKIEVKPTAVTVFPDRARVTCVGKCEVTAGSHKLLIPQLPLTLEPDSLRVSGKGTTAVQILSADVKREFFEVAPQKDVRKLEAEIESLSDQLRHVNDQKAGWEAHGRYLDGMRDSTRAFASGLARGHTQVEDQLKIVAFLQEQDAAMRTAVSQLDKEGRQLVKQIEKLKLELGQYTSKRRGKQMYQAVVDIQVSGEGSFSPELTYVVNQASWKPLYDVRLKTVDVSIPDMIVSTLAEITQRTGQSWDGVDLSVSTARPALNQRLPELKPWPIDQVRKPIPRAPQIMSAQPEMARKSAVRTRSAPQPEMAAAPEPVFEEAEEMVAQVEDSGTAVRFVVAGQSDIPSDGSPHKTTLANYRLEPKMDYVTIPKHTDAVYRRATAKNSSDAPWLAGQANLFVDDEFIGKTKIAYTAKGGDLELLLGVEDRITIKREMTRRDVDKKMLSDQRRIRFGYEIEVENLLETAVILELQDHIPVSRHEQIKVKLQKANPEPKEVSELNLMEWALPLSNKQKVTISYEFTVEHPRSLQVMGLP